MIVATYNLWGFGEPWTYTAERGEPRGAVPGSPAATLRLPGGLWPRRRQLLTHALHEVGPDLVGLQEVCCDQATGSSQADQLALELACGYALQPMKVSGSAGESEPGVALLSRHPIRCSHRIPMPGTADSGQALMHAIVDTQLGAVDVLIAHLTPRSEEVQFAGVELLLAYLHTLPPERASIVLGDLNNVPESGAIQALTDVEGGRHKVLRDAWREANPTDRGPTMPAQAPLRRIDYIFVSPGPVVVQAVRFGEQPDPEGFYPSDHLGVAATLRLCVS